MRRLRILVLMHPDFVPPDSTDGYTARQINEWKTEYDVVSTLRAAGHDVRPLGVQEEIKPVRDEIEGFKPHVVFNLLEQFHHEPVYDQHIPSYLELMEIPYTGCNPRGLILARGKDLSKTLVHYRRIAVALQAASLPTILPKVDDLDIDGYYIPSAEDVTICGDWYDVMELSESELLVTIGDVAGHGLNAAVTMTRIKQAIQTAALLTRDPRAILRIANQTIRQMDDDLFATALVGIFNASSRRLDIASAGHPPPLLREPGGAVRECSVFPAPPLGVQTAPEPSLFEVNLSLGTALVMFTDGLVEWDRNIATGYHRLSTVLTGDDVIWSSHPSKRIAEAVLGEASPRDDIAILVLREGWTSAA